MQTRSFCSSKHIRMANEENRIKSEMRRDKFGTDRGGGGAQPQRIRFWLNYRLTRSPASDVRTSCGWAPPPPRSVPDEQRTRSWSQGPSLLGFFSNFVIRHSNFVPSLFPCLA